VLCRALHLGQGRQQSPLGKAGSRIRFCSDVARQLQRAYPDHRRWISSGDTAEIAPRPVPNDLTHPTYEGPSPPNSSSIKRTDKHPFPPCCHKLAEKTGLHRGYHATGANWLIGAPFRPEKALCGVLESFCCSSFKYQSCHRLYLIRSLEPKNVRAITLAGFRTFHLDESLWSAQARGSAPSFQASPSQDQRITAAQRDPAIPADALFHSVTRILEHWPTLRLHPCPALLHPAHASDVSSKGAAVQLPNAHSLAQVTVPPAVPLFQANSLRPRPAAGFSARRRVFPCRDHLRRCVSRYFGNGQPALISPNNLVLLNTATLSRRIAERRATGDQLDPDRVEYTGRWPVSKAARVIPTLWHPD